METKSIMEILCINNNNGIRENKVLVVTTDGAVILKHSVAWTNALDLRNNKCPDRR